jgi:hypothetical protein
MTLLLQGCGGGGGGSGTAASNTVPQVANGVVTGFGSVFVDGVEIEDAKASVVTENADGTFSNSVLQMGQRIRVSHDGKGTANKVTVDAAVIGSVSAIDTNAWTLIVAGQRISINNDLAAGPLTVWSGGYSSIADVTNNDLVEVHGNPVYDSATTAYKVVATRVQKMAAISGLKINGKISNIDTTAKTFSLNGLTVAYANAALRPTGATLANDLLVTAYGPTSGLSGTTLTASHLKVNRLQDSTAIDATAQVGGPVSLFNSGANTFEVQGVKVSISSSTTLTPTGATVANNAYVKVSGTVGSDGSISATNIQVREQNTSNDLAKVKLNGVISDFVDATSFVVRGIPVDASGINAATACPGVTLANDVPVQISATQQANTPVVLATSMSCRNGSDIVIRPADGVVSSVDSTAKTFVLTASGHTPQNVQWTDSTTFVGLSAATLSTQQVRVEGYLNGATLVARVISLPGAGQALDDDHFQRKASGDTSGSAWSNYRNNHHH